MRTLLLTIVALIAFAANSLLARAGLIDPASLHNQAHGGGRRCFYFTRSCSRLPM